VTGRRLRELQVFAPGPDEHSDDELKLAGPPVQRVVFQPTAEKLKPEQPKFALLNQPDDVTPLVISELRVHKGQSVRARLFAHFQTTAGFTSKGWPSSRTLGRCRCGPSRLEGQSGV